MSTLLIDEPPLQFSPSLAKVIGLHEALMLQQIHYGLRPQFNPHFFEWNFWLRNTCEEWQALFPFWDLDTIQNILATLENRELVTIFVDEAFPENIFYTINYQKLYLLQLPSAHEFIREQDEIEPL